MSPYSKTECQTLKLAAYPNLEQVMHTIMYSSFDRENVIHADLKPENILLEEGTFKEILALEFSILILLLCK